MTKLYSLSSSEDLLFFHKYGKDYDQKPEKYARAYAYCMECSSQLKVIDPSKAAEKFMLK